MEPEDLEKFAKQIYHFQLNCSGKRDVPPLLKRIITNLTCQRHQFMYCPKCKNFDDHDFNPVENIKQFMKFVHQEERKWRAHRQGRPYKSSS